MSQYIGKTISLISNKGVRYVGLLYNISAEDATVALQSVRSFGTEGRMAQQGQPNLEILPKNDVYAYVTFRGSDVKDLSVLDTPLDQVQPIIYQHPGDGTSGSTAPETTDNASAAAGSTSAVGASGPTETGNSEEQTRSTPRNVAAVTTTSPAVPSAASFASESSSAVAPAPADIPTPLQPQPTGTTASVPGQYSNNATTTTNDEPTRTSAIEDLAPGLRPVPVATRSGGPENTDGEFDFEKANARFQREGRDEAASKSVYDKSTSFFDGISLNDYGNMRWSEEKNLNMDTFGESSTRRGRGNWRGRGRGRGRGNWRGRGDSRGQKGKQESIPEWA